MSGRSQRVRLQVSGRVQGVFFRANARTAATRLGLRGWVRNRIDGSVEAVAEGPEEAVEQFIDWCHRGSPAARVDRVEIREMDRDETLDAGFEVRF